MTTQAQELQDHITSEYRSLYEVLKSRFDDINKRLDDLQEDLTQIKRDVRVLKGASAEETKSVEEV